MTTLSSERKKAKLESTICIVSPDSACKSKGWGRCKLQALFGFESGSCVGCPQVLPLLDFQHDFKGAINIFTCLVPVQHQITIQY